MHRIPTVPALVAVLLSASVLLAQSNPQQSASAPKKPGSHEAGRPPTKTSAHLVPLTAQEQAQQMLNRFTFGARPGDLEQVMATGPEKWFEQQLNPQSIKDTSLDKRLGDYPVLAMPPDQVVQLFPAQFVIQQVAQGKIPYPKVPDLAAAYQVAVYRYNKNLEEKRVDADGKDHTPSETEAGEARRKDQATAARVAGELFGLDRGKRMAALLAMPVEDGAAFTSYLAGDQKKVLLAEFTPRERDLFYDMAGGGPLSPGSSYRVPQELSEAKVLRMILGQRQLQEVMTDFWFNHFNVFAPKDSDQWYIAAYERDAIRAHSLGKFSDLLLATAQSPAMMVYLDNFDSIGPNSEANGGKRKDGKRNGRGLNENYAREVMELHTVGVNGGYSQADVTHLAAVLTGWSVDNPNLGGKFVFDPKKHEPGSKQWFGETLADDGTPAGGFQQGIGALKHLAALPQTAHFISWELAQRFVADDPPPMLVNAMARTYMETDGDIKAILLTMVHSREFNSKQYFRNKVKTPEEFLASVFRATATDPVDLAALVQAERQMGMPFYGKLEPTGYYITAEQWMNTTALIDRLNFSQRLVGNGAQTQRFDVTRLLFYGLIASPSVTFPAALHKAGAIHAARIEATSSMANNPAPEGPAGMNLALNILEGVLIGGPVSTKTNLLIQHHLQQQGNTSPEETLNTLTALVLDLPEFQLH
jgi:uncharacterized protein (DUF1800 family)